MDLPQSPPQKISIQAAMNARIQNFETEARNCLQGSLEDASKALLECRMQLLKGEHLQGLLDRDCYDLYQLEASRNFWQIPDLKVELETLSRPDPSDNDYEVLEIVKEIAYCEAIGYSIGYNNHTHTGLDHSFVMWNFQQGHEEIKHFHAIRCMLEHFQLCTGDLDEAFVAESFREPGPEWFKSPEDVLLINFLGEVHNIRAYLLLGQAFDEPVFKTIMKRITDDEVVHKKVFGRWFQKRCEESSRFEADAYACLIEEGMAMHQAKISPHYRELMLKIGRYYNRSGRMSALKFLNQSMRSQYLELKNLFSPEIFKISEYDFRRHRLKAYAF